MSMEFALADFEATEALGARLARCTSGGLVVFLHGDLGAGKTTLVRGFLHALGHGGVVKSPTYTLVEPYDTAAGLVYHFDLYRLADPEELEFMGIRDFFGDQVRCLVEWPEQGRGFLPSPDLTIHLRHEDGGRGASLVAGTARGQAVMQCLSMG